jgi:hypothetical protein
MDDDDEPEKKKEEEEEEEKKEPPTLVDISANLITQAEIIIPFVDLSSNDISSNGPPLIRIDTGNQRVGFASHNSFFDSEGDQGSEMVHTEDLEEEVGLKILEGDSTPLDMGDMEDLNPKSDNSQDMDADDYDVLT